MLLLHGLPEGEFNELFTHMPNFQALLLSFHVVFALINTVTLLSTIVFDLGIAMRVKSFF